MGDFAIRTYDETDFDAVVRLWQECDLLRPWNEPERDIARCRATPDSALFIGEAGGQITATVMVGQDGHRGWAYYLGVDPAVRGHGHGSRMMAHAEAWLTARGVPKIQLMVRHDNRPAQDFYRRLGYVTDPVVVMRRWLVEPAVAPPNS